MKNSSTEIRSKFINFFTSKGHVHVNSSPIIPSNDDKTLLFTNAGMVQFKDIFLGVKEAKYKSAVTSQKCLRAGGKHNDLDNVGFTNRHHTFFEMLGNFSFGDYFKIEAIKYAWEFLIIELKIPQEKMWITVHSSDDEAKDIWLNEIGISKDRLSIISTNDNFWSMGDVGPCGPCTEIFYDFGDKYEGNPPGHGDEGERYVEIWNLVFMQFNRISKDKIIELPKPSVDTGMGLERICAVMQNEHSNYDTDLFIPILEYIKKNVDNKFHKEISSMKVIADHIRSICFLISEGIRPSNEGHGYVLRRIIRRAIRHSQKINFKKENFLELVPIFIDTLINQYKDIDQEKNINQVLVLEIDKFQETLDIGLEILDKNISKIISNKEKRIISGELLFLLYDTYGFPVDLSSTIAKEKNFSIDLDSFEVLMKEQKINSKRSNKFENQNSFNLTNNYVTDFTGYTNYKNESSILDIYVDGENALEINAGQDGYIIINPCPFYAESGGQIGDSGIVFSDEGKFLVNDTQKKGDTIYLQGKQVAGCLKRGKNIISEIDRPRRDNIKMNHSATHLLHSALINNIGKNVQQKGSLVSDSKLRFDFSCEKPINKKVLDNIEDEVNRNIENKISAETKLMSKDEAINMGAMALFGEKYDEKVRVLSFGDVSVELCGGTHVNNTGDIGVFKILSESSISSGIRRIEAITGMSAENYLKKRDNLVSDICQILNVHDDELKNKLDIILEDNKKLKKQNSNLIKEINYFRIIKIIDNKKIISGYNVQILSQDYIDGKILKNILEDIKSTQEKLILAITQKNNNKAEIYVLVSEDCFEYFTAKDIINDLNKSIGSSGGGKDDLAQAGIDFKDNLSQLEKKISHIISEKFRNKGK
tara:strand:+ start:1122 stop:3749 length:2628 start_codon:yes stop_codon:yes gene_type:complete